MTTDRRRLLAWLLAAAGLLVIGWIVSRVGIARLAEAAARLAPWVPFVFLLEGVRWLADAWTTWLLYGSARREASWRRMVEASVAAYTVILLLPAGRLGGEVLKAAAMRRDVGLGRAAAAAVAMQALPLLAGALVSLPCVATAWWAWGPTALTGAIALQAVTAIALGAAILWASRRKALGRLARRVSEELGATTDEVQRELGGGVITVPVLAAAVTSRSLLAAQIALLASAVDVPGGVVGGLLTVGLHFVGQAVGDLVPAQLGATDGALALGAEALGAPAAALVAAALVFHASQLAWAAVGAVVGARMR